MRQRLGQVLDYLILIHKIEYKQQQGGIVTTARCILKKEYLNDKL